VLRPLAFSRVAIIATLAACASSGATTGPRSQPDQITAAEITASGTTNAWDLINRLRPNWLRQRATGSIGGGASSQVIAIYLDGHRYGDPSMLRTLGTMGLKSLRWLDASSAAATLTDIGSDPIAGAIVITSR
jgi:hypothetical protein